MINTETRSVYSIRVLIPKTLSPNTSPLSDVSVWSIRQAFYSTKWQTLSGNTSGAQREYVRPGSYSRYSRERPDTIRCIVASLVGDGESGDSLVDENEPIQPLQQRQADDFTDPNWEPEPIDAGPGHLLLKKKTTQPLTSLLSDFRINKPTDVISTLVSIYDSKDLFVKELQVLLAQRLLAVADGNYEREVRDTTTSRRSSQKLIGGLQRRNIEILKIRFGEAALQVCEVMLRDMTDSRRIDQHVQAQKPMPLHPTIVSRHFWPPLQTSSFNMPGQFKEYVSQYLQLA